MTKGFVYVLAAQYGGLKIGCSIDPERRLKTINRNRLIAARIIHAVEFADYERAEYWTHTLLKKYRLDGDWFSCPPEIAIAAIESVRKNPHLFARCPQENK